jgi:hypothetical protein
VSGVVFSLVEVALLNLKNTLLQLKQGKESLPPTFKDLTGDKRRKRGHRSHWFLMEIM